MWRPGAGRCRSGCGVRRARECARRTRGRRPVITPESRSIISGIGISQIGRRLGLPALALTADASRQAIADAGLTASDIDGIATMGDTPVADAAAELGIQPSFQIGRAHV